MTVHAGDGNDICGGLMLSDDTIVGGRGDDVMTGGDDDNGTRDPVG